MNMSSVVTTCGVIILTLIRINNPLIKRMIKSLQARLMGFSTKKEKL